MTNSFSIRSNLPWLNITKVTRKHEVNEQDTAIDVSGIITDLGGFISQIQSLDETAVRVKIDSLPTYQGVVSDVDGNLINRTATVSLKSQRWLLSRRAENTHHTENGEITLRDLAEKFGVSWESSTEPPILEVANQSGESNYTYLLRLVKAAGLILDSKDDGSAFIRDVETDLGRFTIPSEFLRLSNFTLSRRVPAEDSETVGAQSENSNDNAVSSQRRRLDIRSGNIRGAGNEDSSGSDLTTMALSASTPSEARKTARTYEVEGQLTIIVLPGVDSIPVPGSIIRIPSYVFGEELFFSINGSSMTWNQGSIELSLEVGKGGDIT